MRWYHNPTHLLWGIILLALIMLGAVWLSSVNATNFDETEYQMLREFAGYAAVVVFGGGGITKWLAKHKG